MGRSKNVKPFIDKKNAATFHLVRRSQRDVIGHMDDSDGVPNEFVLMPSPMNPPKYSQMIVLDRAAPKDESSPPVVELSSSYMNHVKQCLSTGAPHVLKDFNAEIYEKYTKPITGEGIFVSAKGNTSAISDAPAPSSLMQELASALPGHEVERTFESITINPDCMDPEVAAALFGDWEVAQGGDDADGENVFEEILDDFVLTACQEPTDDAHQEKSFDYDLHIQQLMERARNDAGHPSGLPESHSTWAKEDAYFFQKANQIQHYKDGAFLEEEEDEESFSSNDEVEVDSWGEFDTPVHGVVPALSPDEERALRKKYEATLAEYDTSDSEDEYCNNEYGYNSTADALSVKIDSSAMMKHKATDEDQDDEIQTLRTNITTVAESQHALMDITDQQLESVLDSYLRDREDRKLAEGIIVSQRDKNKTGGSGYFALRQQPEEEKEDFSLDIIIEELAPAPEESSLMVNHIFRKRSRTHGTVNPFYPRTAIWIIIHT
mmetsp:Transcript_15681/g.22342  ORF Transcript_15681/g.22342 Transcript_15681/m.22342 type:complete len:492 (-) Transcript_15681:385-1860(-)